MNNIQKMPEFGIGKDFESAVTKLEKDLKEIADGENIVAGTEENPIVNNCEQIPINHYFMDGVYVRRMIMYQGQIVIGAIHKHKHMCFLLKGHLSVASSSGVKEYIAPCYIISEPGEKRILYAHEESHWYNTHKNPDNIEDVIELEKQIVALSYEEYNNHKKNKSCHL